jgi:hypothetical protein
MKTALSQAQRAHSGILRRSGAAISVSLANPFVFMSRALCRRISRSGDFQIVQKHKAESGSYRVPSIENKISYRCRNSAVVTSGAQNTKRGATTTEHSKSKMPGPVPPRERTTIESTNAARSIGPAMIHAAKPRIGITETPQVRRSNIQPVRAGPL